jgi:hypothetical protein
VDGVVRRSCGGLSRVFHAWIGSQGGGSARGREADRRQVRAQSDSTVNDAGGLLRIAREVCAV